jgi:Amt family ammonium transporter
MAPHSMTLTMVGASLLWVGWFGFNAGSNLEANAYAALAMINTFVATAAAAVAWILLESLLRGKASMLGAVSGAVTGLVAVTPAAGFAGPMGAIVLGAVATVVCYFFVSVVKNKFEYDDSLDVFGIHCIGGIIGALATGILVNPALGGAGIVNYLDPNLAAIYDGTTTQVWRQLKGVLVTLLWSGIGSAILYKIVDLIVGLRASPEAEREGLDLTSHGEAAYHSS